MFTEDLFLYPRFDEKFSATEKISAVLPTVSNLIE
jgi:hypothetical protein